MTTRCTAGHHEALKLDDRRWTALELIGVQVIEGDEADPEERLELRNCTCGSTLARPG
jgi:hypothetical protein